MNISTVIITLNEEHNIRECIESVSWTDEIIVVDSGSTDGTVECAKDLGATVYTEPFRGYGPQRNFGIEKASNDWILCIDADERVSPELTAEIFQEFQKGTQPDGYSFPRKNMFLGKWIRHSGWYPDRKLRLFRKDRGTWDDRNVHERLVLDGKETRLSAPLLHYPYHDITRLVETEEHYSSLHAHEDFKSGKSVNMVSMVARPLWKFFERYVLKRGFLDGEAGFIIGVSSAYSMFLRYAKLKQIHKREEITP